jgi:hypothetical protein
MSDRTASPQMRQRLRAALARHGVECNSRTPYVRLVERVEAVVGKRLTGNPSEVTKALNDFAERGIAADLPAKEWRPLIRYAEGLRAMRDLAELSR